LSFPLIWRETPVHIRIDRSVVEVTNRGRQPIDVMIAGTHAHIPAGQLASQPCAH